MQPGTIVAGRYRIVRHLGSGAMASVHLAEDPVLGRQVAIKSVHAAPESELGRRIRREAQLGAGLTHPHLVTVFDTSAVGDEVVIVMELVPGETLDAALARGPLEPARAVAVLRAVAEALDHIHARGVVHRDVKPANILLSERGTVKLADLGVATSDEATRITRTGGVLGTAAYMAPEQFDPGPVTPAADVYALATVAFQALTGRKPYTGATFFEVMARVREGEPPDARTVRSDLPEPVADALRRGMAREPDARPITAGALVDELEAGLRPAAPPSPEPQATVAMAPVPEPTPAPRPKPAAARPAPTPPPAPPSAPRRRPPVAALAGAAAALIAAVVLVLVLTSGGDEPEKRASGTGTTTTAGSTAAAPPAADETPESAPAPATSTPAPPADEQAVTPSTPARAVRAFYERAADDDLDGAWALAGPGVRAQLGPRATFDGTFRTLQSIRFDRLSTVDPTPPDATVRLSTVATHTDRTDRCTGTARTRQADDGTWQVERLDVRC